MLASAGFAHAAQWGLQTPVTPIAESIVSLHSFIFAICVVIFIGVFGVMFYSIFDHRKSLGHQAETFHENTTVEVIWTDHSVRDPGRHGHSGHQNRPRDEGHVVSDLTIKATGYQWKWGYDYLKGEGEGISFYSNLATPRAQIEGEEAERASIICWRSMSRWSCRWERRCAS